jgi:aminoacyl-tRNA hydrolase
MTRVGARASRIVAGALGRNARGRRRNVLRCSLEEAVIWVASRKRPWLRNTLFIGVTGSTGKTTAKNLIGAVLSTRARVRASALSYNVPFRSAQTVLATTARDAYCVLEMGVWARGDLDRHVAIARPSVGVVTEVGVDHLSAFGSSDGIAAEKGKLIASLPASGIAVLNVDDVRVAAMAARCRGRVVTYGLSPGASLRATDVQGAWPDRLSFTATWGGESIRVQTQLVGTFWITSVLAALATGLVLGVPLSDAASALATVPPAAGRMSPEVVGGVTFLHDDFKASPPSMSVALDVMREARAPRKIVILGTMSDYTGDYAGQYPRTVRQALEAADHVCLVGLHAFTGLRAKRHPQDDAVRAFANLRAATAFMREFLRPGDLVLLKGSNRADHLIRVVLDRKTDVQCWRDDCHRLVFCTSCDLLRVPSSPRDGELGGDGAVPAQNPVPATVVGGAVHVVVGLGNPGDRYEGTLHNVGQRAVRMLAERLGGHWSTEDGARLCRVEWRGLSLALVEPLVFMNRIGEALIRLRQRLPLVPETCILVQDDLDLPLGRIRSKLNGSEGGHRGVRSVLQAFQSDTFPRVKIGVGRPARGQTVSDYVLSPIATDRREVLEQACRQAGDRVLEVIALRTVGSTKGVTQSRV